MPEWRAGRTGPAPCSQDLCLVLSLSTSVPLAFPCSTGPKNHRMQDELEVGLHLDHRLGGGRCPVRMGGAHERPQSGGPCAEVHFSAAARCWGGLTTVCSCFEALLLIIHFSFVPITQLHSCVSSYEDFALSKGNRLGSRASFVFYWEVVCH